MPSKALFLALLGLSPRLASAQACDAASVEQARKEARVLTALGKDPDAARRLEAARAACPGSLWLLADLSSAYRKLGDSKKCLDEISKVARDYPASPKRGSPAPWAALAAAYRLCGCADVREPLCRDGSWLKKGYAETVVQVHPTMNPFVLRLDFKLEEEPKRGAAGGSYIEYRAVPTSLEVRRAKDGAVVQRIPIPVGEAESGPSVPADFLPAPEEKRNLLAADMNFDGYLDLGIAGHCGNGGCCTGNHWLFVPAKGRFEFSEALAGVCFAEFDPKRKEVRASYRSSAVEHGSEVYRWKGDKLALVERITETADEDAGRPSVKVERLKDGRLAEVPPTPEDRKGAKLTRPFLDYRK